MHYTVHGSCKLGERYNPLRLWKLVTVYAVCYMQQQQHNSAGTTSMRLFVMLREAHLVAQEVRGSMPAQ